MRDDKNRMDGLEPVVLVKYILCRSILVFGVFLERRG